MKRCATYPLLRCRLSAKLLLITAMCISVFSLHAQDIHFTQFFTNPLVLNPAQTGYYNGNYRLGFNFKAQWPWAINGRTYTYHTESPYVDLSFGENKLKSGWMGVGVNFVNDEAGDGRLTYRRIGLSYAYHQAFDKEQRYVLSAGVVANYVLRSLDYSKYYFNNQWVDDVGFNTGINPQEPWQRDNFGYFDLGAGIHFGAQVHKAFKLLTGFSMLHINRPKHSFLGTDERLGIRYRMNVGGQINFAENISLQVDFLYGHEKKAQEITTGALFAYGFQGGRSNVFNHLLYTGVYYRAKDALAPVIGYGFKGTRLLFSYDVTLSKLLQASNANGGPELSLVHVGNWQRNYRGKKLYCPRF